jgi:hypothetical protein
MDVVTWKDDLKVEMQKEYYLTTDGTNLQQTLNLEGVDHTRTICNDIHEVNQVLGIDAACNILLREISKVLDQSKVHIDYHHLHMLKSSIGKSGYFERCSRFGFGRNRKRGWMKRSTFEELVRNLKESALAADVDDLQDNASCLIVAKHVPLGTHGPFELFEDVALAAERAKQQRQPQIPLVYPPMTNQELEGIIPILKPPYTPLQTWMQVGFDDDKQHMDYRWQRYEMGKERHIPNYEHLMKPKPMPLVEIPTETPPLEEKKPLLFILELLPREKVFRQVKLQNNIRKKCQGFLFKKRKGTKRKQYPSVTGKHKKQKLY